MSAMHLFHKRPISYAMSTRARMGESLVLFNEKGLEYSHVLVTQRIQNEFKYLILIALYLSFQLFIIFSYNYREHTYLYTIRCLKYVCFYIVLFYSMNFIGIN